MIRACFQPISPLSRHWILCAILCLALGWGISLSAWNQDVLHNADVVTMTTAQLSPETIILKIESSVAQFDTSPDALAALKAAGVSDAVIAAMIKASTHPAAPATSTNAAPSSSSTSAGTSEAAVKATVYLYRPGKFIGKALEPSVFLDEQKLLDMDNGRYLALKLEPGRHVLRSNEKNSEIDQAWEAGTTYYVRLTIAAGMMKGRGQMGMVTEKLAVAEMQRLRPLDKDNIEPDYLPIVDLTPIK